MTGSTNEELIEKYKAGDLFVLQELVTNNEKLVKFFANKYKGLDEFEDLVQVGWEAFFKAVETYNPDKENSAKFSTWLGVHVNGQIMRYLDRQPKDEKSLNEPLNDESETTLEDTLNDEEAELAAFKYAEWWELRQELENVMQECLPLKQREIVKRRVAWEGIGEPWSLDDIAQAYGIKTRQGVLSSFEKAMWRIRRSRWGREQIRMRKAEKLGRLEYDTEASALERLEWQGY